MNKIFFVIIFVLFIPYVSFCADLTSCGTISTSGTYTLKNNISSDGTCLVLNSSNTTIDLNGYTITYNTSSGDNVYGIATGWNLNNVIITDSAVTHGGITQGIGSGVGCNAINVLQGSNFEISNLNINIIGTSTFAIKINGGGYASNSNIHNNNITQNVAKANDPATGFPTHYSGFSAISVDNIKGVVQINNNTIIGKGNSGIGVGPISGIESVTITGNTINHASPVRDGYGISIGAGSNLAVNFNISNNNITSLSGRGILIAGNYNASSLGPQSGTISYNTIDVKEPQDSGEYLNAPGTPIGIQMRFGAGNVDVHHNTIYVYAGLNTCPKQFSSQTGDSCHGVGLKINGGKPSGLNNNIHDNNIIAVASDANYYAIPIYGNGIGHLTNTFYNNTISSNSVFIDFHGDDGKGDFFIVRDNIFNGTSNRYNNTLINDALSDGNLPYGNRVYGNVWQGSLPTTQGVCGPAAYLGYSSQPTDKLCKIGTPSSVSGSGPWTWTCSGLNGGISSDTCTAVVGADITSATASASPSAGSYSSGQTITLSCSDNVSCGNITYCIGSGCTPYLIYNNLYKPYISSSDVLNYYALDYAYNVPSVSQEVYTINNIINGVCGSASGQSYSTLTSLSPNLCASGSVASFSGSGPWTWGCNGANGGSNTAVDACHASLSIVESIPPIISTNVPTGRYVTTQTVTLSANETATIKYCTSRVGACIPTINYSTPFKVLQNVARHYYCYNGTDTSSNTSTTECKTLTKQRVK
jgi:hypothetical protein